MGVLLAPEKSSTDHVEDKRAFWIAVIQVARVLLMLREPYAKPGSPNYGK